MHDPRHIAAALDAAITQAEKSWHEGGIPIGSVLMNAAGIILAAGHNRRVQDGDPTAHAEAVCIRSAGRRRDWSTLTLVSTLSPCAMCSGTAILHRIPRVIIGENRSFLGAEKWMRRSGIHLTNLDDARCVAWMARLIEERPDLWGEDIGRPVGAPTTREREAIPLHLTARLRIHEGKLDAFLQVAARCIALVRERDRGTLEYEWFLDAAKQECIVRESYRDSDAVLEHVANLGETMSALLEHCDMEIEFLGEPSPELLKSTEGLAVRTYGPVPEA